MHLQSVAETSASNSAISNQGTGPTTSPEQAINRESVKQGNTSTEKSFNKPLGEWAQVSLVQQAMNQRHNRNFKEWGVKTLASLLDYQSDDGASMDTYITFFRDLLLFLATPKVSQQFSVSVPTGLKKIQVLSGFFIDLLGHTDYDQYVAYHRMYDNYKEDESEVFLSYAEDYLTGEDLRQVMAAHGRQVETSQDAAAILQNEGAHLVALLDKYFPGVEWKDDKLAIASHEKMKWFLEHQEEKRVKEEQQTPAEKKAEEVRRQIQFQLEHGFYFKKETVSSPGSVPAVPLAKASKAMAPEKAITPPPNKPGNAVSARTGAATTKKPASSPTKKPAPVKKPTNKKA